MVVKYHVFLDILFITGISRSQNNRPRIKFLFALTIFLYCISTIHFIMATLYCAIKDKLETGVSYLFVAVDSLLIYYFLLIRRKKTSRIMMKLLQYRNLYCPVEITSSTFVKSFIVTIFLAIFVINQISLLISVSDPHATVYYWTFGFKMPEGVLKTIVLIMINISQYIAFFYQVFLTLVLCIIFCKFTEMLKAYNNYLQHQLHEMNKQKIMVTTDNYFNIQKTILKLYQVLSYPTFFIMVYSSNFIFSSLLLVMTSGKKVFSDFTIFLDFFVGFAIGTIIMIPYAIFSSMVTEKLFKIKKTVRGKLNELAHNEKQWVPQSVLQCLKRIEKDEIEHVSACGLFHISRGFIFTAIGTMLTYDLLIINYL